MDEPDVDQACFEPEQAESSREHQHHLRFEVRLTKRPGQRIVVNLPAALLGVGEPQVGAVLEQALDGLDLEAELELRLDRIVVQHRSGARAW